MARKKKQATLTAPNTNLLMLPPGNKEMDAFIKTNKTYLTEQVLSSIEFAVEHNLPLIEVFTFNDSDYVITLTEDTYLPNVNNIYDYYIKSEQYEFCPNAVRLQSVVQNYEKKRKSTKKIS